MSANFSIEHKKSNGNLHIRPRGDFDGSSAWQLINLLHEKYDGKGRVFIDTHNLQEIHPFGCNTFRLKLDMNMLPANRLFFKGERGFEIAPKGAKVIVAPKGRHCNCAGNCAGCRCSKA